MELQHLQPQTPSHRNGPQELETSAGRITSQNHHIFQSSQLTILETTTKNIMEGSKGSIGIVRIQL